MSANSTKTASQVSEASIGMDWSGAKWPELANVPLIAVDTETTGLTQSDRAVSCGLAVSPEEVYWFSWGHQSGNNCTIAEFRQWALKNLVPDSNKKVFHNAQFDLRMLWAAGVDVEVQNVEDTSIICPILDELTPQFNLSFLSVKYFGGTKLDDTELNEWCAKQFGGRPTVKAQVQHYWRAPGSMVAEYCLHDARLTYQLYQATRPLIDQPDVDGRTLSNIYDVETQLIPMLVKMTRIGFRVDVDAAHREQDRIQEELVALQRDFDDITGGINPNSTKQMAEYFEREGITVPRTLKGGPSVTGAFLETVNHPAAQLTKRIRKLEKFSGTFIQNYVLNNVDEHDLVHPQLHQLKKEDGYGYATGTVSGRFSSSGGLNIQNIPSPDPDKPDSIKHIMSERIRSLFVPYHPDQDILSVDYSQIEFRIIAHYGGGNLRREYNENPTVDFHDMVATLTGIPRKEAKNINFGLAYGMGAKLMSERLGVTLEEAKELLTKYHARVPEVRDIYDKTMRRATNRGYLVTLGGRKRRFIPDPERRFGNYKFTHKALNALAQGGGADIMKTAMVKLKDLVFTEDVIMHATVHDEIVCSITKNSRYEENIREIKHVMESCSLGMTVPVMAECKVGPTWGRVAKWRPSPSAPEPIKVEAATFDEPDVDDFDV